jgi:hypothetical protein
MTPQEGAQRDELLYLRLEVLPAQFPVWRRSHIRQSLGIVSLFVLTTSGGTEGREPTSFGPILPLGSHIGP